MRMRIWYVTLPAVLAVLSLGYLLTYAHAQESSADSAAGSTDPIIGTWVFDSDRSYLNIDGKAHGITDGQTPIQAQFGGRPKGPLDDLGKWVVSSERGRLRFQYYKGDTADSNDLARSFVCAPGGKPCADPDPTIPGRGHVARLWRLHPLMIAWQVSGRNGHVAEMIAMALSTDGRSLTVSSWYPQTPNLQNMQVFGKVGGAPLSQADSWDFFVKSSGLFTGDLDASFPLFATWVRNEAESSFNRGDHPDLQRNSATPRPNRKWVMSLEDGGVRQRHYDKADSTEPRVSVYYKFDGNTWKNPHGAKPPGEVVQPWLINPYTQIRHLWTPEKPTEWSFYVVSDDRKTMTVTAWDQVRPWRRNIQVFDNAGN